MSSASVHAPAGGRSTPARPALFSVTWPLFSELLLGISVGMAGLWLASRISDNAAGAFAMVNHLHAAFFILFRIISMGVSVVITQNLGAGNHQEADQTARVSLAASSWMALGVGALVAGTAPWLLGWMNAPAAVLPLAVPFLMVSALALALDAYNATMASVMRAHLHARDTLYVMLAMHLLHLVLAVPLMRGFGPLPALGLVGFALAMVVSRVVGLALHLWLWRLRLGLVPRRRDWWVLHWQRLSPVLHIGLPGGAENIAYRIAFMVSVAMVARMGAVELATHSYTLQVMYLILLFGLAIGFASEILVGHMVGAAQLHEANRLVRKSVRLGLLVSTSLALLAALTAPWIMSAFTQDPHIIEQATVLLWLTVLLEPGRSFNLIVINALRAAGDARFPVLAGIASMVFVLAGGSWFLGVHLDWGLPGVWVAYAADEWVRGLTMAARWRWRGWVPHARATRRRVSARRAVSAAAAA